MADYNEAIRLDPRYSSAYHNRGKVWYARKDLDKALADYSEAIRLDPKYSLAYVNRGVAWNAKQELDKALADYGEAIRLNPKCRPAHTGSAGSGPPARTRGFAME